MHIANLLHELHGGPTEGVDRPLHLRQAKARMFRRKPDVGRQQELDATPGAVAVDGCDDGLRIRFRLQEGAVDHPGCLLGCRKVVADICASTERPITRSGDDYAAAVIRAIQPLPNRGQLCHHGARHRVALGLVVDPYENYVMRSLLDIERHSNLLPGCAHGRHGPRASDPSQDWTYRLFDSIVCMAPVHPAADPTIAHESAL